jgi:FtsP/CotA-like multicopper oxidase with cupredoxin domain
MTLARLTMSRRRLLAGGGSLALSLIEMPAWAQQRGVEDATSDGFRPLRAYHNTAALPNAGPTPIWRYDGSGALRIKRGEELRIRLINDLGEPTAVHWHGLRLPNAMDGVPDLTQTPVTPGGSFDYRFRPPDAGTFWFHPVGNASTQTGRGLRGALIVEEDMPVAVDRDMLLMLEDWPHVPAAPLTVNGAADVELAVRTNERLRLRLINAAVARALALRFERHAPRVMAIDGEPAEPFVAREGRVALAPGNRVDVFMDLPLRVGERAAILLDDGSSERAIVRLAYADEPARAALLPEPKPLPPNPLPERLDLRGAARHDATLDTFVPLPAKLNERAPLFSVRRGRVVVLAFANLGERGQTIHLHGHHVRLLDRLDDGWKPYWLDTLTVAGRQTARVAFLADNPGKWLIEAQSLRNDLRDGEARTAAWFAVT